MSIAEGYSFVRREQLQRYAVIQMDVRGRDVDGFVKDANAAIAENLDLPPGYWIEWGGAFANQQRALTRLSLIVPITIFFIFVLLYTAFNSIRYALLIIANVPFATLGGIISLWLTGQYLSVPSAIGFIAVFGVAMLNGIVLVSFINELRSRGRYGARSGSAWCDDAPQARNDDGQCRDSWLAADVALERCRCRNPASAGDCRCRGTVNIHAAYASALAGHL